VPGFSLLTVAVPTCNGARHVAEALRGILAQPGDFALAVCDDRSDDDTLDVVRATAGDRARIVVNSERLGLAGNWNRCVALSATPWIAIFHQDDVMESGHLAGHLRMIEAHPEIGFVCGAFRVIDDAGQPVPPAAIEQPRLADEDRLYVPGRFVAELAVRNPVRCSTATIRKAAHEVVGGFDPAYRYVVDWDFWLRMARGHAVAWLAKPTVSVRWHAGSETSRLRRGTDDLDEVAELLERLHAEEAGRLSDGARPRREADRRLARAFLNRAYEAARAGDGPMCRVCLRRAVRLDRAAVLGTIFRDPRLAARLAAGVFRRPSRGA
jgi:hypothetical protein